MKNKTPETTDFPKLAAPAERALAQAGYVRLKQLTRVTEAELGQLHGMGPNALGRLREALALQGLSFAEPKTVMTKKKTAPPVNKADKT